MDSGDDKWVHPTEMPGRATALWVLLSSFSETKGDQTNLTVLHSSTPLTAAHHSSCGKSITPVPAGFSTVEGKKKRKFLDSTYPTRIAAPGTFLLASHGMAAHPKQAPDSFIVT